MALRDIKKHPKDGVLRKQSREVKEINKRIINLLDDMAHTMKDQGMGLAAPQVGILKRVIIVDLGEGVEEYINPVILSSLGCVVGEEGCLSIPGRNVNVERPTFVKMKALNRHGEDLIVDATGMKAVVLCHEIDHLDGVLILDRMISEAEGGDTDD